jgi:tetratricopeptide (TPR) repeat protein
VYAGLLLAGLAGLALPNHAIGSPLDSPLTVTGWTSSDLHALRTSLGVQDERARRHAWRALSRLGDDANEAIAMRFEALRAAGAGGAISSVAAEVRKRMRGQSRTERNTESAVLTLLQSRRDETAIAGVEWLALVNALEHQRTCDAANILLLRGLAIEKQVSADEGPGVLERLGSVAIPALIRCRNHPKAWLRPLCAEALHATEMELPARALQQNDARLITEILRAYGDTLVFEAMPAVVSHLVDERTNVRNAANSAVERFGKNAIWQLRERYLDLTGRDPSPHWSHERLLSEIRSEHAGERLWLFENARSAAKEALEERAPAKALDALESILEAPPPDEALETVLPWLVRAGELAEEQDMHPQALAAFRRALRISPAHVDAQSWRARVVFLEAEYLAAAGQLQFPRYEKASQLDAKFAQASKTLLEIRGASEGQEKNWRRLAAALAGSLLTAAALVLLRDSAQEPRKDGEPPEPVTGSSGA